MCDPSRAADRAMYIPGVQEGQSPEEIGMIRLCTRDRCYLPYQESLARQMRILDFMMRSYNSMLGLLGLLWVLVLLNPVLDNYDLGIFVPISMVC